MTSEKNKKIAKNTAFLYLRMLFTMGMAFYSSRILLNALGVEDYGIYNVVGGVVAMFSFITGSLVACTQRFLNYEIGLENLENLEKIFNTSLTLNFIIAILFIIIAEIVGVWFINNKLVIPPNRLTAAHWVFQFSIIAATLTIITTPYIAVIIAHEQMKVFSYISILETGLKLSASICIIFYSMDRLIIYASLIVLSSVIILSVYILYSRKNYRECHYHLLLDRPLVKKMACYTGWNFYGSFSFVVMTQGINILLNLFFGPVVNASRAIAVQVQTAIQGFSNNFTMAVNPQITQNYAQGNRTEMLKIVFAASKFCFFLLCILSVPILIETEAILRIWLKEVPEYSVIFVRLILIQTLVRTLQSPLHTSMHATGKMRKYQLWDGTLLLSILPISYLLLKAGYNAPIAFVVSVIINFIALFVLLYILKGAMAFPVPSFFRKVFLPAIKVSVSIILFCSILIYFTEFLTIPEQFIYRTVLSFFISVLLIWYIGLSQSEHHLVKEYWIKLKNRIV